MNKRKWKKHCKYIEDLVTYFATSYREIKELDRSYHEYMIVEKRKGKNSSEEQLEVKQ